MQLRLDMTIIYAAGKKGGGSIVEYLKEGYEGQLLETDEDINTILKKQIFYIENIMKEFKDDCVSIYVHHMY